MMWGNEPTRSALLARDYFQKHNVKNLLIPGIGYGRNARPFLDAGMSVTGIEISETAIELARSDMGLNITIHHGAVSDIPFDEQMYDGIFCHAVIHLLDEYERRKFIRDCYAQLSPGGSLICTAISTKASSYGKGIELGPRRYEQHGGARIFFYDESSMSQEFSMACLVEIKEIFEPSGKNGGTLTPFLAAAICRKED